MGGNPKTHSTNNCLKKKGLEEASKIGGDPVKKKSKAEIEAIDATLELYLNKEKGKPFYIVQGVAITKEQLEEKMNNPEWVKGFKAGRWDLKVSNDKETENKLAAIYDSKDTTKTEDDAVQEPSTEKVDAQAPTSIAHRCMGGGYMFDYYYADLIDLQLNETVASIESRGWSEGCPPLSGKIFTNTTKMVVNSWE